MAELADRNPAADVGRDRSRRRLVVAHGRFKPLLPFGERTLIGHVVASLRAAGVQRIHVVTGFEAEALAPEMTGSA